jgi:hypothetical protein
VLIGKSPFNITIKENGLVADNMYDCKFRFKGISLIDKEKG